MLGINLIISRISRGISKILFVLGSYESQAMQCRMAKLDRALFSMIQYCKITVCPWFRHPCYWVAKTSVTRYFFLQVTRKKENCITKLALLRLFHASYCICMHISTTMYRGVSSFLDLGGQVQSNLAIRNFLVTLKLFLIANIEPKFYIRYT